MENTRSKKPVLIFSIIFTSLMIIIITAIILLNLTKEKTPAQIDENKTNITLEEETTLDVTSNTLLNNIAIKTIMTSNMYASYNITAKTYFDNSDPQIDNIYNAFYLVDALSLANSTKVSYQKTSFVYSGITYNYQLKVLDLTLYLKDDIKLKTTTSSLLKNGNTYFPLSLEFEKVNGLDLISIKQNIDDSKIYITSFIEDGIEKYNFVRYDLDGNLKRSHIISFDFNDYLTFRYHYINKDNDTSYQMEFIKLTYYYHVNTKGLVNGNDVNLEGVKVFVKDNEVLIESASSSSGYKRNNFDFSSIEV